MRPTKKDLEHKLASLDTVDTPECNAFTRKCRAWTKLKKNQDKRGTKAAATKKAYYACVQFKSALNYQKDHDDSSVRRAARQAVTAVLHQSFGEIRKRLTQLHGKATKAGRRTADRRREAGERILEINDRYDLKQLCSVRSLRRVGQALDNCVASTRFARRYVQDVENGRAEMWVLRDRERPVCLINVHPSTRTIGEFEAEGGSTPKLKPTLARAILKKLDVDGDEEEAFVRVGAFRAFLNGRPDVTPLLIQDRPYWVWIGRDGAEIIIATRKQQNGRKRWSRFTRNDRGNESRTRRSRLGFLGTHSTDDSAIVAGFWNYLSEGELLGLVLDHPALARKLQERSPPVETG